MGTSKDGKDGSKDGKECDCPLPNTIVQPEQVYKEKPCSLEAKDYYAKQDIYKPEIGPLQVFNI